MPYLANGLPDWLRLLWEITIFLQFVHAFVRPTARAERLCGAEVAPLT